MRRQSTPSGTAWVSHKSVGWGCVARFCVVLLCVCVVFLGGGLGAALVSRHATASLLLTWQLAGLAVQ